MNSGIRCGVLMLALAAGLASPVLAQEEKRSGRVDEILDAFDERTARQLDEWFINGDFPRMLEGLEMQANRYPHDEETHTNLIYYNESAGRNAEALAAAIHYRTLNSSNPNAYIPEANHYFAKKLYTKSACLLEEALKQKGGTPHRNLFVTLSQSWKRMGFLKQAIRVWEKQLEVYPDDAVAKSHIERTKAELAKRDGSV